MRKTSASWCHAFSLCFHLLSELWVGRSVRTACKLSRDIKRCKACVSQVQETRMLGRFETESLHIWWCLPARPFRNHTVCRAEGPGDRQHAIATWRPVNAVNADVVLLFVSCNFKRVSVPSCATLCQGHMEVVLDTGLLRTGILTAESTLVLTSSKHTAWQCSLTRPSSRQSPKHWRSESRKNLCSLDWGESAGRSGSWIVTVHDFVIFCYCIFCWFVCWYVDCDFICAMQQKVVLRERRITIWYDQILSVSHHFSPENISRVRVMPSEPVVR